VRHPTSVHLVLVAAFVLAACADDDEAPSEDTTEAGEPAGEASDTAEVAILDDDGRRFEPADVSVAVGGTVTWTHEGSLPHTVTASDGAFDSGNLAGGETFSFTAEEAGTIDYACSIHPDMTGTITVS
jgi:plastocyanin